MEHIQLDKTHELRLHQMAVEDFGGISLSGAIARLIDERCEGATVSEAPSTLVAEVAAFDARITDIRSTLDEASKWADKMEEALDKLEGDDAVHITGAEGMDVCEPPGDGPEVGEAHAEEEAPGA